MKKFIFVFICFVTSFSLRAQSDKAMGSLTSRDVYGEILGGGLAISANFDSRFSGTKGFGYRVGFGFLPIDNNSIITIPVGLNALVGNGPSFFEAELTAALLTTTAKFRGNNTPIFIYPHIGYRYTKPTKSFIGRIYVGPMFYGKGGVVPWLGISAGYTL